MKKYIISMIVISLVLFSCSSNINSSNSAKQLSDSRFNGNFVYFDSWKDANGIEENYEYDSYDFDGTNKFSEWYKYKRYSKLNGWSFSSNYPNFTHHDYEIEINSSKTMFRTKFWDNKYDTWGDWQKYEFRDNGQTLRIYAFPDLYPNSYKDYTKE